MGVQTVNTNETAWFAVGQVVDQKDSQNGEFKAFVLDGPCAWGFYAVKRVYDDVPVFAVVHGDDLLPSALSPIDEYILGMTDIIPSEAA